VDGLTWRSFATCSPVKIGSCEEEIGTTGVIDISRCARQAVEVANDEASEAVHLKRFFEHCIDLEGTRSTVTEAN